MSQSGHSRAAADDGRCVYQFDPFYIVVTSPFLNTAVASLGSALR
jgi:hypothetical protein